MWKWQCLTHSPPFHICMYNIKSFSHASALTQLLWLSIEIGPISAHFYIWFERNDFVLWYSVHILLLSNLILYPFREKNSTQRQQKAQAQYRAPHKVRNDTDNFHNNKIKFLCEKRYSVTMACSTASGYSVRTGMHTQHPAHMERDGVVGSVPVMNGRYGILTA